MDRSARFGRYNRNRTWCFVNDNVTAIYTLDTSVNTLGYNISQIDVFTGWDGGRCVPNVTVPYPTVGNSIVHLNWHRVSNGG